MQNLGSAELGGWVAMGMNPVPVSPACPPIWSLSCVPGGLTLPQSHIWAGASCERGSRIVNALMKPQDQQGPDVSPGPNTDQPGHQRGE